MAEDGKLRIFSEESDCSDEEKDASEASRDTSYYEPNGSYVVPKEVYDFNVLLETLEELLKDKKIEGLDDGDLKDELVGLCEMYDKTYANIPDDDVAKVRVGKALAEFKEQMKI